LGLRSGCTCFGFAIADLEENNIWALFIHPDEEGHGIGKRLHQMMMNWYFSKTTKRVWLSTAADSRAEKFYRKAGWQETGFHGKGEIKFEMSSEQWKAMQRPDFSINLFPLTINFFTSPSVFLHKFICLWRY
jgi:RimJ/RimL family protein N-acetyltransferase